MSPTRKPPAAHRSALAGPSGACLPSVPVGLSVFRGEGIGLYSQKCFCHRGILTAWLLPKLVAADGDAGGNGENGSHRAPRGVFAAAAGDEENVLALHGYIFYLGAQHLLQANGNLLCSRRRF